MALSLQEKLALAMTSAGSQRNLAALLGITHQKLGRWLREGEELPMDIHGNIPTNKNGTRKRFGAIPDDIATVDAINTIFEIHKDIARAQARADHLPFFADVPVYYERRPLRTGEKGDRVISGNTEHIRLKLRVQWEARAVQSNRYIKINVRSRINLKRYFAGRAAEEVERRGSRGIGKERLANIMLDSFIQSERKERGRIVDKTEPFSLFTRDQYAGPDADAWRTIKGIEEQLAEKHSPATGEAGTRFAYEYLLQMIPPHYVRHKHSAARSAQIVAGKGFTGKPKRQPKRKFRKRRKNPTPAKPAPSRKKH